MILALLTLCWGANWPAMKIALGEIPVWTFRTICLTVGGVALLAIGRLSGASIRLPLRELPGVMICSLFAMTGWHLFSGYGLSMLPAGRAAIIAFTMPIWAALLSTWLLKEALTARKLIGLALGTAGLALLIGPDLQVVNEFPLGALLMLGAAVTWAIGTVALKCFRWTMATTVLVGWQLLVAMPPIAAGALIMEDPLVALDISARAAWALLYVLALPMVFCQWAYFRTVRLFPAFVAATSTLAIPIVGVYSSALVLGEPVGWRELGSLALVCSGLVMVLLLQGPRRRA